VLNTFAQFTPSLELEEIAFLAITTTPYIAVEIKELPAADQVSTAFRQIWIILDIQCAPPTRLPIMAFFLWAHLDSSLASIWFIKATQILKEDLLQRVTFNL